MSKTLAHLLNEPEILVSSAIQKLESLSHYASEDVRLVAEIKAKLRSKVSQLGLDADDTTAKELYHGLMARVVRDEQSLANTLGVGIDIGADELIDKIVTFVGHISTDSKVWVIKNSVAKKLLRSQPPRNLMKKLNYRSVDSLVKRESTAKLLAAVDYTESQRWQKKFHSAVSALSITDFEERPLQLVRIDSKRLALPAATTGLISVAPQSGIVVFWPQEGALRFGALGLILLALEAVNELKFYSFFIRTHQTVVVPGKILVKTLREEIEEPFEISHMPVSWHNIFKHYGRESAEEHTRMFESMLELVEAKAVTPLDTLSRTVPALHWWRGLEHVADMHKKTPVSLNLLDLITDKAYARSYQRRSAEHFRKSLWHELIDRYLEYPGVKVFAKERIYGFAPEPQVGLASYSNSIVPSATELAEILH